MSDKSLRARRLRRTRRARHGRSPGGVTRSAGRVAQAVAGLLSVGLFLAFGYGWYEYRSLNESLQRVHLSNLAGSGSGGGKQHVKGSEQNILVVGLDSRAGLSNAEKALLSVGDADSLSTDTIMVIHVPADGSKATLISIPRDSYVDIPGGYLKNKINAAYADAYSDSSGTDAQKRAAGANELVETVHDLTGLEINHYVQVGFGGFYTITKAIGDIPVNLCHSTDDTVAYNEAHGEGPVGSNFKMTAGRHDLTPVEALEFVRQRHNLDGGDLAREKRQQYFLKAAFKKIASAGILLDPGKVDSLIKAVAGTFYVDDNGFSLVDLAAQLSDLSSGNIVGYTIPLEGPATVSIAGQQQDVERVDPATVRRGIASVLAGGAPAAPSTPATTASRPTTPTAPATPATPAPPAAEGCIN